MQTTNAQLKTEQFNDCPAQDEILKGLEQIGKIEFVDVLDRSYWQNEEDTVVVKITQNGSGITTAVTMAQVLRGLRPDEVHTEILNDAQVIMRLWWD